MKNLGLFLAYWAVAGGVIGWGMHKVSNDVPSSIIVGFLAPLFLAMVVGVMSLGSRSGFQVTPPKQQPANQTVTILKASRPLSPDQVSESLKHVDRMAWMQKNYQDNKATGRSNAEPAALRDLYEHGDDLPSD